MTISEFFAKGYTIMPDGDPSTFPPYCSMNDKKTIERIMNRNFGTRELYDSVEDSTIEPIIQQYVADVFTDNNHRWGKLFNTTTLSYDPLSNNDYAETHTDSHSGMDHNLTTETYAGKDTDTNSGTDTTSLTVTPTTTETTSKRTYDASTFTDTEKHTAGGSESNAGSTVHGHKLETAYGRSVTTETTTDYGNQHYIGRTISGRLNITGVELIEKERSISQFNFFSIMALDIADAISLYSYNFEDPEYTDLSDILNLMAP